MINARLILFNNLGMATFENTIKLPCIPPIGSEMTNEDQKYPPGQVVYIIDSEQEVSLLPEHLRPYVYPNGYDLPAIVCKIADDWEPPQRQQSALH